MACSVITFHNYIQVFTSTENSMTGRAHMGEVLIQIWLKFFTK